MPLTVDWAVLIDGINCTSRFNPYVVEIEVEDKPGDTTDTARILLADDGRLILPKKGGTMAVQIMGVPVFKGTLETPRFTLSKGQGGFLVVSATGVDLEGEAKQGQHFAKENATLGDYLEEFAGKAGLRIKIDPALQAIKRAWWGPEGRDFLHEGRRLAAELGGVFKIQGGVAILAKRGSGLSPSGQSMPSIQVERPGNFIGCDIEVSVQRAAFKGVQTSWFDRAKAEFVTKFLGIGGASGGATAVLRGQRADADDAQARAQGRVDEAEDDQGGGTCEISIEPRARAEGSATLSGIRAGIDGGYRIEGVTHTLSKQGASTRMQLKRPGDDVGSDDRTPSP